MEKFQFTHIETYPIERSMLSTRKGSMLTASDILAEAARQEGHISHIRNPKSPIDLSGYPVKEVYQQLKLFLAGNKKPIKLKNGKVVNRSVARDTHILLAAIYSYPVAMYRLEDESLADAFFQDCLSFHEKKFGQVHCAVLHMDESYPHIHVYTFSTNAKMIHPGFLAKRECKMGAYNEAMRFFQDSFYAEVSEKHGLERTGPLRQRIATKLYSQGKTKADAELEWYQAEIKKKKKLIQKELEQTRQNRLIETNKIERRIRDLENEYIQMNEDQKLATQDMSDEIDFLNTRIKSLRHEVDEANELQEKINDLQIQNQLLKNILKDNGISDENGISASV